MRWPGAMPLSGVEADWLAPTLSALPPANWIACACLPRWNDRVELQVDRSEPGFWRKPRLLADAFAAKLAA
jgi:hypothetical protein